MTDGECGMEATGSDTELRAEARDAGVELESGCAVVENVCVDIKTQCVPESNTTSVEIARSDKLHAEARDAGVELDSGCAVVENVCVKIKKQCGLESDTTSVEEKLTAFEKSLDATEELPSAVQDVLANARLLLKCVQKAQQDAEFTADELIMSLHQSLEHLEEMLDGVEARPANVLAVTGAVKRLVTALKTGES